LETAEKSLALRVWMDITTKPRDEFLVLTSVTAHARAMLCESLRRSCEPTVPRNYECRSRGRGGAKEIAVRGSSPLEWLLPASRLKREGGSHRRFSPVRLPLSRISIAPFSCYVFPPFHRISSALAPRLPMQISRASGKRIARSALPISLSLSLSLSLCSDPSIALFPFAFGGQDSLASLVAINQTSISKKHFVVRQSAGFMVRPSSRDKSHGTGGSSDLLLSSPLSRISSPCCIAKLSSRFSSWSPMLRRRFLSIKIRRVQARENLERLIVPAGRTERDTGVHVLVAMQSARPPRSRESASCFLFLLRCPSCASRVRRSRSRDEMEVSEI